MEIEIYFLDQFDIEIDIKDYDTETVIGSLKSKSKEGINSIIVNTDNLEKGKSYSVEISYRGEKESGSFSNGFKSKH